MLGEAREGVTDCTAGLGWLFNAARSRFHLIAREQAARPHPNRPPHVRLCLARLRLFRRHALPHAPRCRCRYGITQTLDSVFTAPAVIKRLLCDESRINEVYLGDRSTRVGACACDCSLQLLALTALLLSCFLDCAAKQADTA